MESIFVFLNRSRFLSHLKFMRFEKRATIQLRIAGLGFILVAASGLTSCVTPSRSSGSSGKSLPAARMNSEAVRMRNQQIAQEPQGNFYIGRRWFTDGTRYWGYLRRPRQTWAQSQLVVMNESILHQPDRVPEIPRDGSRAHGFDHNAEYRLWGTFTGVKVYDPNSNLILPEFRLSRYQLIDPNPGFLFYPGEPYARRGLPPMHPPTP